MADALFDPDAQAKREAAFSRISELKAQLTALQPAAE